MIQFLFKNILYTCAICAYCFYCCLVTKLCLPLFNPMDYSPPGSSVHGIFQARALEWGAIAFSVALCETVLNPELPKS